MDVEGICYNICMPVHGPNFRVLSPAAWDRCIQEEQRGHISLRSSDRLYQDRSVQVHCMMLAQQRNCLTTHFIERIPLLSYA